MNKRKVALIIIFASLAAFLLIYLLFLRGNKTESVVQEEPAPAENIIQAPPLVTQKIIISPGKTITDLLTAQGFSRARVLEIRESIKNIYDLARLPAGKELRLLRKEDQVVGLQLDLDPERYLDVDLTSSPVKARLNYYPVEKKLVLVEGEIEDSLIAAVNRCGEQDMLALMLADIFGWDIDFYVDLRKGDRFKLLVEKKYVNGQFVSYSPIIAAYFINKGQFFEAFRFEYPQSNRFDYFDARGNSLRREFLKSPLRYGRITSRFSLSRLHPIRKIYRPHYGVDYAAPVGTPVQATAAGVVTYAGWNGGAGQMIKIRHNNAYETMYLHLRGFAPGIRVGARVQGGQVIGYVGSTGESTGPHLDYRILFHGRYVNPLSWKFQPAEPLSAEFRPEFARRVQMIKWLMNHPLWVLNF